MQSFKKTFLVSLSFLLLVVGISFVVIEPWMQSGWLGYQDSRARRELAGSLDYLVVGASHGLAGFVPQILDEELNCNSYNLSNSLMTMYGRYELLKKELQRNQVDTVILELSYNTLIREHDSEYGEGDAITLSRFDTLGERIAYLTKHVAVDDWLNIYSRHLMNGVYYFPAVVIGNHQDNVDRIAKGHSTVGGVDLILSKEEILSSYNTKEIDANFREEVISQAVEIIQLCKDYGCNVVIAVTPVADALIWESRNMDSFREWAEAFSTEYECPFVDFNLLKNRYSLFSDSSCYYNENHLSEKGAKTFTKVFASVMQKLEEGQDVKGEFYTSYEELKNDSPYMSYYRSNAGA